MSAQQGNSGNRIKKLCIYALLASVCIIFSFIESLIPTALIAPGVKLGISNCVALMLVCFNDCKGAVFVNCTRIIISALLFGSPFSFLFSFSAGIISLFFSILLKKLEKTGILGISITGAVIHNIVQLAVAVFLTGKGVIFYSPILIASGIISGAGIGILCKILTDNKNLNSVFNQKEN